MCLGHLVFLVAGQLICPSKEVYCANDEIRYSCTTNNRIGLLQWMVIDTMGDTVVQETFSAGDSIFQINMHPKKNRFIEAGLISNKKPIKSFLRFNATTKFNNCSIRCVQENQSCNINITVEGTVMHSELHDYFLQMTPVISV